MRIATSTAQRNVTKAVVGCVAVGRECEVLLGRQSAPLLEPTGVCKLETLKKPERLWSWKISGLLHQQDPQKAPEDMTGPNGPGAASSANGRS